MSKPLVHISRHSNKRVDALVLSAVLFIAAYLLASRAIDTGSWQQYTLSFILLGFVISEFVKIFRK